MMALDYTIEQLAQIGFNAYGDAAQWTNYLGKPIPTWEALEQKQIDGWCAAAEAIARSARL